MRTVAVGLFFLFLSFFFLSGCSKLLVELLLSSQGPNKALKKMLEGEKSDATPNNSNACKENGPNCGVTCDSSNGLDHPSEVSREENGTVGLETDEIRPLKKAKNQVEEKHSIIDEGNSVFSLYYINLHS